MKAFTKRILAILMTGCMLVTASCSKSKKEESPSETVSDSTAEIEFVTNPDEPDLGAYTTSALGTKLYYEPENVSHELMLALEKYFITFAERDFETYKECVHPEYIKEMNEFLEAEHGYDIETSFNSQCDNLSVNAGGDFRVSRIRAELPEEINPAVCLDYLNEFFETESFYETINNSADALYHLVFYVMSDANGEETLLISEFEIVFAEIDGKYYTFG